MVEKKLLLVPLINDVNINNNNKEILLEYQERRLRLANEIGCHMGNVFILHYQEEGDFVNGKHYPHHLARWLNLPLEEGDWTFMMFGSGDQEIVTVLATDLRMDHDIWSGQNKGDSVELCDIYDVNDVIDNQQIINYLRDLILDNRKSLFYYQFLGQNKAESIVDKMLNEFESILLKTKTDINLLPVNQIIDNLRLIKSQSEIRLIREACKISVSAHREIAKILGPNRKIGLNEQHLDGIFTGHIIFSGADRTAYPNIIASGLNTTILHYAKNKRILQDGDLLLIDAGAEYNGYASDITRTYPVSGKFTEAQLDIYRLVLKIQTECIKIAKPGCTFKDLQNLANIMVYQGLSDLGMFYNYLDDDKFNLSSSFFMHGIGHWLGLQVHDCQSIKDTPFQPGMVITIEPGIYISNYSISSDSNNELINREIFNKYYGFGIRIEDVILITDDQPVVLSDGLPKEIDQIEWK
ncbi:MAG: M24B family metallopeptidase [Candidatus Paceibacterota bacterium]